MSTAQKCNWSGGETVINIEICKHNLEHFGGKTTFVRRHTNPRTTADIQCLIFNFFDQTPRTHTRTHTHAQCSTPPWCHQIFISFIKRSSVLEVKSRQRLNCGSVNNKNSCTLRDMRNCWIVGESRRKRRSFCGEICIEVNNRIQESYQSKNFRIQVA